MRSLPESTQETNKYGIGQRVLLGEEIGTVVAPESSSPFDIWVFSPKKGYASCYDFTSVKPLPGGQL